MKNITVFSILLCLLLSFGSTAQTATGGCSTVKVTSTPAYDNSLFFGCNYYYVETCALFISPSFCPPKQAQYQLERQVEAGWTVVVPWQNSGNFSGLGTHGTYRVAVRIPVLKSSISCENGCRKIYDVSTTQWLGCLGEWSATMYTNTVIVGATVATDNSYVFTESNPSGSPFAMDADEVIGMDASASKNYNFWWLAICENSFDNCTRYKAKGWTDGTVGQFNLTSFWAPWTFNEWTSYEVQFVVENKQCLNGTFWNVKQQVFFVCAPGTNCRFGEDGQQITLGPNPASSYIQLNNFEPDLGRNYEMVFTDLAGKKVKSVILLSDQVDVSDLPGGMFVVNILQDARPIFTSKLIVNNR